MDIIVETLYNNTIVLALIATLTENVLDRQHKS